MSDIDEHKSINILEAALQIYEKIKAEKGIATIDVEGKFNQVQNEVTKISNFRKGL